jgi:hypothetical protein
VGIPAAEIPVGAFEVPAFQEQAFQEQASAVPVFQERVSRVPAFQELEIQAAGSAARESGAAVDCRMMPAATKNLRLHHTR